MSIFAYEVDEAIAKLEKAGVDVIKDDYVIYAAKYTEFDNDLYPLPVIIVDDDSIPDNVAYIAKRNHRYELQTVPVVTVGKKKSEK